jgi:hypothetical protein
LDDRQNDRGGMVRIPQQVNLRRWVEERRLKAAGIGKRHRDTDPIP